MDKMSWNRCAALDSGHHSREPVDQPGTSRRQTRFYGPDGRSTGTATTSGNTTTFYGADGRRTGSATTSSWRVSTPAIWDGWRRDRLGAPTSNGFRLPVK